MNQKSKIPMNITARLESWSKPVWAVIGSILIAVVGLLDYLTGYELSFSLFYLIPISLVVWFAGRWLGVAASIVSAIVWVIADVLAKDLSLAPAIRFWNSAIPFGFFIIVALLLASLKEALEHEKSLARSDYLTGATSLSFFYDLLQIQMDLFQRYKHPFTVAYVDIDNFKTVNDQFGHTTGDTVLRSVVTHARNGLRKTDIVARLGGDELTILLPETDQETAQLVISKTQQGLLDEMKKSRWPVTFSIGVITFNATPATANELMKLVDDLMYTVKRSGKNAILYDVFAG
jgi:diguanylate cyclase (GGDEF)-like protein